LGGLVSPVRPAFTSHDRRAAILLGGLCLGLFLVDMIWLTVSPVELIISSLRPFITMLTAFLGLAFVYTVLRPAAHVSAMALVFVQIELFSVMATILSYLVISLGHPLQDDFLAHCDAWLGFDWNAYADLVRGSDWGMSIFGNAYLTAFGQVLVLALIFGLTDQRPSLYRLVGTLSFGLLIILLISIWMPAIGAYLHSGHGEFGPAAFGEPLRALHDGRIRKIDFAEIHGVITFPSYHAVISLALILASWPSRFLRYPVLLLETVVLLSVPAFGEHYLSDVLAGIGVAFACDRLWRLAMGDVVPDHNALPQTAMAPEGAKA
jgi:hypothetical protein